MGNGSTIVFELLGLLEMEDHKFLFIVLSILLYFTSVFILACTDTAINNIYGSVTTVSLFLFSTIFIVASYIRIYLICRKLLPESSKKAMHTLVTHLINFSIFLIGVIFIFIRYRIGNVNLPISSHILLSITYLVLPPLLNPLVFGARTTALKLKIIHRLKQLKKWRHF